MKRLAHSLLFPVILICMGCNHFLTKEPQGSEYDSNYFDTDPLHPQLAVNAIYDAISWDNYGRANEVQGFEFIFGDICSDDADVGSKPGDGLINTLLQLKYWQANPSNVSTRAIWINMYAAITRANYVLTYIDNTTSINKPTKDRLKGEALFLRGYAYFYLARMFGGVPLIDHILQSYEYGKISRATLPQTYSFIETDWNKAKTLLPAGYPPSDAGRATQGAALGYLARAIMYQLGTDNTNGHSWQEVFDLTTGIINLGKYALAPNYATIFEDEMENGPESIFEIQFLDNGASNSDGPGSTGSYADQLQNPRSTWGWGYNTPSASLVAEYETGDPRLPCTVLRKDDVLYGVPFKLNQAEDVNGKLNRKAALAQQPSYYSNGHRNHRKMRYADVILMHAEAAYYLGQSSLAIEDVNKIRARARASTLPKGSLIGSPDTYVAANVPDSTLLPLTAGLNGKDLLNAIWHERRVEFGMEALRFWDLVRTNRYSSSLPSSSASNSESHSIMGSVNKIQLFPITSDDIQFSVVQNLGY